MKGVVAEVAEVAAKTVIAGPALTVSRSYQWQKTESHTRPLGWQDPKRLTTQRIGTLHDAGSRRVERFKRGVVGVDESMASPHDRGKGSWCADH